jgi:3'(2'), 5'-bisphosphate nucleotidase
MGDVTPQHDLGSTGGVDAQENDAALATRLAVGAGRLLVELRRELWARGAAPWQVMDSGDMLAHQYLVAELTAARPGDTVMSEEGADDHRRVRAERVWIVDPLDGTNEYGEPGRHDWAVHVALW